MKKSIEVKIAYTDKDIKEALLYLINRVHNLWAAMLAISVVDMVTLFYGYKKRFNNESLGLIILFLAFTLIFYLYWYQRPVRGYINFYKKRKGGTYIFSEENIQIVGAEVQSTCSWSVFKKAQEVPSAFLIYDRNKFMYIFPKRCFDNEIEIEQLRWLLSEKIEEFKRFKE